jgi:hypothetical protein
VQKNPLRNLQNHSLNRNFSLPNGLVTGRASTRVLK